jgi:Protein of unknown function (DUF3551)
MRHILSALALCALGFAANSVPASAEITYPYCAEYGGRDGGGRNCGFWTYQQCIATVSGQERSRDGSALPYQRGRSGIAPAPRRSVVCYRRLARAAGSWSPRVRHFCGLVASGLSRRTVVRQLHAFDSGKNACDRVVVDHPHAELNGRQHDVRCASRR